MKLVPAKRCRDTGINYELRELVKHDLEDEIVACNEDPRVSGIIVYYPVYRAHSLVTHPWTTLFPQIKIPVVT